MNHISLKQLCLTIVCTLTLCISYAANFYWRATPVDDLYTNIGNWETAPGNDLSPSVAPTVNDDVFFPAALSITRSINLNGGACRNFNFAANAVFNFAGSFTINGSLQANGNAFFNIVGSSAYNVISGFVLTFGGTGNHTIDMGTSQQRFTGGGLIWFTSVTTGGTYALVNNDFITDNTFRFVTQGFVTNGNNFTVRVLTIEGATARTMDFSNSTFSVTGTGQSSDNIFTLDIVSPNAIFIGTNTRIAINSLGYAQLTFVNPITIGSLILNNSNGLTALHYRPGDFQINTDSLIINNLGLDFGRNTFSGLNDGLITLNAKVIKVNKPVQIKTYVKAILGNVDEVIEPTACKGQSTFQAMNGTNAEFQTNNLITTSDVTYRGINFTGAGVQTSSSYNGGFNTGSISWTATVSGTTFYWVGQTGNWNDPTEWSILGSGGAPQAANGCLPRLIDDVVFDQNSFTANQIVTINTQPAFARNITFSDPNVEGMLNTSSLIISGNADFTGARDLVCNIQFIGSGNHTITSGAIPFKSNVVLFAGSGTYTLLSDLTFSSTNTELNHMSGSLILNGKNLTCGTFASRSYPSNATNMRHLDIRNSVLTHSQLTSAGAYVFLDNAYLGSLLAEGSTIVQLSNNYRMTFATAEGVPLTNVLTNVVLNDVTFPNSNGQASILNGFANGSSLTINNFKLASNALINFSFTSATHFIVDTFWLTSGKLYQFGYNTYTITGGIEHVVTACEDLVQIKSVSNINRATFKKASGTFDVNGVVIKDIISSIVPLNVINGQDGGNNQNVIVSPATGRDLFWVNGTGNWSDGHGHWSIGVSGGNPAVTNPNGCIPRLIDNVYFDAASFNASGQIVTLDMDGECRNMLWDANAGADAPRLVGANVRDLNVWGTLEFAQGMAVPFLGRIQMLGNENGVNTQSIKTNGVSLASAVRLNGIGRYDLLDSFKSTNTFIQDQGSFYTNQNNMELVAIYLNVRTPNSADISYSKIVANSSAIYPGSSTRYSYAGYHSGTNNWNAVGSKITNNGANTIINGSVPVTYDTIIMNTTSIHDLGGSPTALIHINRVEWLSNFSNMKGNFEVNDLFYKISSTNTLQEGKNVLVKDSLIANGTPCLPLKISSSTAGVPTSLASGNCSFDLSFATLTNVIASTCNQIENRVLGSNGGNAQNWEFAAIDPLSPLGNDTLIMCHTFPFLQGTEGFGNNAQSYLWNTGETTPSINITQAGTYSVTVNYASGCTASGSRTITTGDTINPVIICPVDVTNIPMDPGSCTASGVVLGTPTVSDNCVVGTPSNNAPTAFPLGTTIVTWTVTDSYGNSASCTQNVTVVDNQPPTMICPSDLANIELDLGECTKSNLVLVEPVVTDNCTNYTISNDAPAQYPVGETIVTWTVVDAGGNSVTCTQKINVIDGQSPTVNCPTDITGITVDPGLCTSSTVVLVPPVADDNCGVLSTTSNAPAVFPVGTTTVVWSITDVNGNITNCNQLVTVVDNINPQISCSANIVNVPADLGACTASGINLGAPVTSDNCTALTVTNTALTNYPVGLTTVTWTVTDASGNSATCAQTVTVIDTQNPTIVCPADLQNIPVDNNQCTASNVNLGTPVTNDNCGVASYTNNAPTVFPIGQTTVTWTVTDINGNSSTCTQNVTVVDNQNPTIACPVDLTSIFVDANTCTASNVNLGTPVTSDNCGVASTTNNAPTLFPVGNTVVTWTVIDVNGNSATCTQNVTVVDNQNPTIVCPANLTDIPADNNLCTASNVNLGTPVTSDNCGVAPYTNDAPATFPIGTTTVTWTVTDVNGNTATCSQTVTVIDNQNPTIVCPADITSVPVDQNLCTASNVNLGTPVTNDNCGVASYTNDAPAVFPIGQTTVTWTVVDVNGNSATCTQLITVVDTQNPTISCPSNLTSIVVDVNSCTAANVVLGAPVTTDNCSVASTISDAPNLFPVGTTIVTWTVTDANGNTATCAQTVTVLDTQLPTITCPSDLSNVFADANSCTATNVNLGSPVTVDNCSILSFLSDAPAVFPIGNTLVTWTVTDASGNTATCTQNVTVIDNQNPTIVCPVDLANIPVDTNGCTASNVILGTPTVNDNCSNTTVTNNAPLVFPMGLTVVTWTVTDGSGNTATCTQNVTVVDTQNPTITCPADIINLYADEDACFASNVALTAPTFEDNCSVVEVLWSMSGATVGQSNNSGVNILPNYTFNSGTTVVTYVVRDQSGNLSTCSFNVIVQDTIFPTIALSNLPSSVCEGQPSSWTATAADNCNVASIVSSHVSGSVFPVGTTNVVITVTDNAGNSTSDTIKVVVHPLPIAVVSDEFIEVCRGIKVELAALSPQNENTYSWYFNNTLVGSASTYVIPQASENSQGTYHLVVENSGGCIATDEVVVKVNQCGITIVETFSPNGDGVNETFHIENLEAYPNTKVWILTRWGIEVYQSDNYQNDWDGRSRSNLNFSGDELPEGTYYYLLELGGQEGQPNAGELFKGFVYIKR